MEGAHSNSNNNNIIFVLWIFLISFLPLAAYPANLIVKINEFIGGQLPVSSADSLTPEMAWIFPKVVLLLLFAVIGLLWLRKVFFINAFSAMLLIYMAALLFSALLSGDDLQYILLGGDGRMDGVLYSFSLIIFMLVGFFLATLFPKHIFNYFYLAISISAILEVFILIAQRLGHDFMGILTRGYAYKNIFVGTIGNPGMLAGLLLPIAMLSVGVASSQQYSKRFRYWAVTAAILTAAGISLSANKSSFYGLLFVLMIFLYFHRSTFSVTLSGAVVAAMFIAPLVVPNITSYDHPLIPTANIATRPAIWKLSLKAIKSTPGQPLLGAGPDALRLTILKKEFIKDMLNIYRFSEKWPKERQITSIEPIYTAEDPIRSRAYVVIFSDNSAGSLYRVYIDKAHNLFLDRALTSGLLSAIIWVVLYLFPVFQLLKNNNALSTAIACALIAIFLYYLFWFPVPQVEPVHVSLLAIAWAFVLTKKYL